MTDVDAITYTPTGVRQPPTWAPRRLVPPEHSVMPTMFQCPSCHHAQTLNAYAGPPQCLGTRDTPHAAAWMTPERVVT